MKFLNRLYYEVTERGWAVFLGLMIIIVGLISPKTAIRLLEGF